MNRVAGLETEYGCLTNDLLGTAVVLTRVRDWVFRDQRYGLIDVHQRDWDEPAGNGGFLFNGGRAYLDMGHFEYCTPECLSLMDIVRYDRAGDMIIQKGLETLRLDREAGFFRNNVDHYSGATFGCHENFLVRRSAPLTEPNVQSLLAFLTLRLLYVSAGKVGSAVNADGRTPNGREPQRPFQISQRADYINNDLFEWVQFNRAIINTRDEPLADARKYRRLHLLHGDTNVLPLSLILKIGTTSLVLDLLEADAMPHVHLEDAVSTFRTLSHNPEGPWIVRTNNGKTEDAVTILMRFCSAAKKEFTGRDTETDRLLKLWENTLNSLREDPESLVGTVDWITKQWLFSKFIEQEKLNWNDPWLKSQDLEFHHIDPKRSLGLALRTIIPEWEATEETIEASMSMPPGNTRAALRSEGMHLLKKSTEPYYIDWEIIGSDGGTLVQMLEPFQSSVPGNADWLPLRCKTKKPL